MRSMPPRFLRFVIICTLISSAFSQDGVQLVTDKFFLKLDSESFANALRSDELQIMEIGSIDEALAGNLVTDVSTAFANIALREIDPYGLERIFVVHIDPDPNIIELTQELSVLSEVEYAEPIYIRELYESQHIPNDALYAQSWHHPIVDNPSAWDIQTGSDTVIIAIIDTGVDTDHPDLVDNLWNNPNEIPGNGIDDDGNDRIDDIYGWDFTQDDADVSHEFGWHAWGSEDHGTHCAGIASGVTNNFIGIAGASHNSKIMTCKIFPYLTDVATANALLYAADNGAHILSNSWGGGPSSETLQSAILYARDVQGCLVLFAAGNSSSSAPHFPGANNGVICVGASNESDNRASFSNYGTWVDMCAPGTSIWSSLDPDNPIHDNLYAAWDGTSMATPLVAGIAALVKSQFPGLSVEDLEARLLDGDDVGELQMGLRVNALKALTAFNISHAPQTNIIDPVGSIPITAEIFVGDGVELTVTMNFSVSGSEFTEINMIESEPGIWTAVIPEQTGGSVIEYYIHAADDEGNEVFHPLTAPGVPHFFIVGSMGFFNTLSFDNAETDQNWSLGVDGDDASSGIWVREDPIGTWSGMDPIQPEDDHSADGTICFVTGNAIFTGDNAGANDVDGGSTTLESPQFPITPGISPILSYFRWYSNDLGDNPGTDTWRVQVRNQEFLWITLEQTNESNNSWIERQFLLDNYVPNSTFIQLRFIANDNPSDENLGSFVEAAVDDIRIFYAGESAFTPGDVNMDAALNVQDLVLLVAHILGTATLEGNAVFAADFNLDSEVNIQDVVMLVAAILG